MPCLFHLITSFYCPGCGVTRMFISLFKLKFYQAFRYNMLVFIFLPFIIFLFIDYLFKKNNALIYKINHKFWNILLVITILFGIIRNIFPFFGPVRV